MISSWCTAQLFLNYSMLLSLSLSCARELWVVIWQIAILHERSTHRLYTSITDRLSHVDYVLRAFPFYHSHWLISYRCVWKNFHILCHSFQFRFSITIFVSIIPVVFEFRFENAATLIVGDVDWRFKEYAHGHMRVYRTTVFNYWPQSRAERLSARRP